MRPLLGTFVEIGAAGDEADAQRALTEAFATIQALQSALSFQDPDSELSRLNRQPGKWVSLDAAALRVLRLARAMGIASEDRFNCTVGGQMVRHGVLPAHNRGTRIDVGCSQDLEIRLGRARLRRPVVVTLDGIAKGFAVDTAVAVLRRHRLPAGWVNAGGDLRVYGERRLEILRRGIDGSLAPLGALKDHALASSYAGAEPLPGWPGCVAGGGRGPGDATVVSVRADRAWRADALTKVAAATPREQRADLIARLGGRLLDIGVAA